MNSWKVLQKGDLIDVVAPAWPTSLSEMKKGISFLEKQGFVVRLQKNILKKDFLYASDLKSRQEGFQQTIFAKDSKAILCLRGGYGCLHILPFLMKWKKPKICKVLIGSSDISILHYFVNQKWDWPSLHGPMLSRLGNTKQPLKEKREFIEILKGKNLLHYKNLKPLNTPAKKTQTIKAPIIGGNLMTLQSMIGTALPIKAKNKILFFEEVGERGYRVDRMLHHFLLAGVFQGVKAIVLGDFLHDKEHQILMSHTLLRFFSSLKCPVFKGLPCGHGPFQRFLPLNTSCTLRSNTRGAEMFCQTGAK